MRCRRVADPEPHLARAVDPAPPPGHVRTLADELLDAGVPLDAVPRVEAVCHTYGLRLSAEAVRHLLRRLGPTPAGRALERAVLGADGRSLDEDAQEVGSDRNNLNRAVQRIRRRLEPTGPQPAQR